MAGPRPPHAGGSYKCTPHRHYLPVYFNPFTIPFDLNEDMASLFLLPGGILFPAPLPSLLLPLS